MDKLPVLSIITVHLNDFEGLFKTFKSLDSFGFKKGFEWIVIDGKSFSDSKEKTDYLELIQNEASVFISEPDRGIYDAMNKGTNLANGKYILYLNAGDKLHPNFPMHSVIKYLNTSESTMIWGTADVQDRTGAIYARKTRSPGWLYYGTAVFHQAIFFRRSAIGNQPYDLGFDIAADYDLVCGLYKADHAIELVSWQICIFDLLGKSGENKRLTLQEEAIVRQKHFKVPSFLNRSIMWFKYLLWHFGTLAPSFRKAWSHFF